MPTFTHNGLTFIHEPHAVGDTANGRSTAAGAVRRITARRLHGLCVLDICCGVGLVGLSILKALGNDVIRSMTLSDINIFNVHAARATANANALRNVEVLLSDGIKHLAGVELFDLVISNPPHLPLELPIEEFTPSWLGSCDQDWAFHRHFYSHVHEVLKPNGEVWFLENNTVNAETCIRPMIEANRSLAYDGLEWGPEDPAYYWMMSRRVS